MTRPSIIPVYWEEAKVALSVCDPVLQKIIEQYPALQLEQKNDAFTTLARAIVGQQISVKAADSVWSRFINTVSSCTPQQVLKTKPENLRSAGLSQRKVEYVQDLADHFASGKLDPSTWTICEDEILIEHLTAVRGIGRWTAEMFLIFHLLRPNVFPVDDLGLQKAIQQHYFPSMEKITSKTLKDLGETWRPWRSVATWYLWRSLDPIPVSY